MKSTVLFTVLACIVALTVGGVALGKAQYVPLPPAPSSTSTIDVSQPVQVTSDSHYERGQSVCYDGTNYWLFYGRSASVTATYQTGDPETHDYVVCCKKAGSVADLATATAAPISGVVHNANSYLGETGAAFLGGNVWAFATIDVGTTAEVYGWYTTDGSSWTEVGPIVTGLSDGQAHHDEIAFGGQLFVVEGSGNFTTTHSATPKTGGWSGPISVGSLTGGLVHFFIDGSNLYLAIFSAGTNYIYQYQASPEQWNLIDSVSTSGWDPTLYKIGSDYVFAQAPWTSEGGGRQWVIAWTSDALDGGFFDGASVMVSEGRYGTETWVEMWPIGFTDSNGDTYLFYTSERKPGTPGTEIAGNIWYLEVDWDVANDHHTYLKEAVDAATGTTINIGGGTYIEGPQIVIDKNLTIVGDPTDRPVVKPAGDTGSSGDSRGWWLVNAACNLDISNIVFDGDSGGGRQVYQGIRALGTGTVDNCEFRNIHYTTYIGMAIAFMDANWTVKNSTFANIERLGVIAFGAGVTDAVIRGNTYTGKGSVDGLDYAVEIGGGAVVTICNNTITDCLAVASSDGSTSAGILVTTYFGAGSAATIEGNTITNCTEAIAVGYDGADTSTVIAHYNYLAGNTSAGIGSTAPAVDAEDNWWGTLEGSGISGMVSGNVDYTPWLWTSQVRLGWGGARLESTQNTDGGWGWPLSGASAPNTVGPIGMGLAKAYRAACSVDPVNPDTNVALRAALKAALQDVATFLQSKTVFSPSDGYLAAELDGILGGTANVDHVKANFYDKLAAGDYYGSSGGPYTTAGYVLAIRNSRSGTIANLAAWDLGMGLVGAASCGVSGSELDDWIQGVKDEIDELDGDGYYDVIGLAGAVYGLAFVGEDFDPTAGEHAAAGNLNDLADILAGYQLDTGGFTWNSNYVVGNEGNETIQETAYACLALNEIGGMNEYRSEITAAVAYMSGAQLCTGGWENYVGSSSGENNEVTAEALWGLSVGNLLELNLPTASLYVKPGESVVIDMDVSNLLQKVNGCQAIVNFSSACFLSGTGDVTVAAGGGVWNDLIWNTWTTGGDLDIAVGIQFDHLAVGTDADATTAIVTLKAKSGITLDTLTTVVFRADVDDLESTWLSDMSASAVTPNKVDSQTIVIDATDPAIDITSAKQGPTELLGTGAPNALQGQVDIDVEASDLTAGLAGPPTVTVTDHDGTPMTVTYDGESPTGTFNYHVTVTSATAGGAATIYAEVWDKAGNTSNDADTFNINKNQITGTIELQSFVGTSRDVVFVSTGTGDSKTWTMAVDDFGGGATGTFTLTDVPDGTTDLSAKTAWHLRSKVAAALGGDGQATAGFTGDDKLLGGDLNGTNTINILDYAVLKINWYTVNDVADINGDGGVSTSDYSIMKSNWFKRGDEE